MSDSLIHPRYSPEITSLISNLEGVAPLVRSVVNLPRADVRLEVIHPKSIDDLLDTTAHDPEFNLPYWAQIWPSGIALADAILTEPQVVRSQPVIELGCGLGITAAAATMGGASLVATDYSSHSLQLTALTCLLAKQPLPELRQVNWRALEADLLHRSGERWPVVLAADVLYEERDIDAIQEVLDRIVAPNGLVWLAEPGRKHAKTAIERAQSRGWQVESTSHAGPWPNDDHITVTIHKLTKPPGSD